MKVTYRFMPGVLLALMAPAAMADQTGWYLGATAGVSDYSSVFASARTLYKQETGFTIVGSAWNPGWSFVGGYRFNRYFSLEAQDFDMGSNNSNLLPVVPNDEVQAKFKLEGVGLDAVVAYPFGDTVSVYAKAGLITSSLEEVIVGTGTGSSEFVFVDQTKTNSSYDAGAGLQFDFSETWSVRLGYNQYRNVGDSKTIGSGNVNYAYLAAQVHF